MILFSANMLHSPKKHLTFVPELQCPHYKPMNKIEHEGVVVRIEGHTVGVKITQSSACSACHAQTMCGISEQKEKEIEISDVTTPLNIEDKVMITGQTAMGLKAVFYAFIVPLVLMVLMTTLGIFYFHSESIAALMALLALGIYFVILYFLRDIFKKQFVFTLKKAEI
ncbi:MAG: hypothetical protein EZS26_000704 [Candidatus Ordinivivax streblomastigis]|uniref:Fis family transcriptional regulator n=1 Tax=Candidatus Ordinivivax streblomastigis TaxID=2540710 RepID=A0A5M8P3X4_9BACT|nr:MAG: hypothetical protein EZS26_000704 [Candidatus Ordinivivax streblomastigis]